MTSRGNKNCHSAEEGNKENPNLILKEVVIYYRRGESSGVHIPEVLFIQISEEITIPHIFFSKCMEHPFSLGVCYLEEGSRAPII